MVNEDPRFKSDMMRYYEKQMNEYRNVDSGKYEIALRNYQKYASELGIQFEPVQAVIKAAN